MKNVDLVQGVKVYLQNHPGATAYQIASSFGKSKTDINRVLYSQPTVFQKLSSQGTPKWRLVTKVREMTYAQVPENVGMLQHIGYKTGDSGLPGFKRRAI